MTTEKTNRMIEVMQAFAEGKKIQYYSKAFCGWVDWVLDGEPSWDWKNYDYRIKPEEEKPQLMTNRQLNEWLAKGNGQFKRIPKYPEECNYCSSFYDYLVSQDNDFVRDNIHIRSWGSDEWVVPTVDVYERDCKGVNT